MINQRCFTCTVLSCHLLAAFKQLFKPVIVCTALTEALFFSLKASLGIFLSRHSINKDVSISLIILLLLPNSEKIQHNNNLIGDKRNYK